MIIDRPPLEQRIAEEVAALLRLAIATAAIYARLKRRLEQIT
jgi:hypothetical protein